MLEIKLPPLNDSDINWIIVNSYPDRVTLSSEITSFPDDEETLYFLLNSTLSVSVKQRSDKVGISNLFQSHKNKTAEIEMMSLSAGDVFGEVLSLSLLPSRWVKVTQPVTLLALKRSILQTKLQEDTGFASRFYQAMAMVLLDRLNFCIDRWLIPQHLKLLSLQDIPLLFGELNDRDVDWIVEGSRLESIAKNTVLIQAGKPVHSLYILLQGNVALEFWQNQPSTQKTIFPQFNRSQPSDRRSSYEFARITRGEMIGDIALLDDRLPAYTFKALENLQVLTLNRQHLLSELEQNPTQAVRFFKAIAIVLSARFQSLISQLENGSNIHQFQKTLSHAHRIGEEIDLDAMDNISLGGVRFNWMLKRLKISA